MSGRLYLGNWIGRYVATALLLALALGCGGGGGGGGSDAGAAREANREAAGVIVELAERIEWLRVEYFRLTTEDFTKDFMAADVEISDEAFEAYLDELETLYLGVDELEAAFEELGLTSQAPPAVGRVAPAAWYSAAFLGELAGKYTPFQNKLRYGVIKTLGRMTSDELAQFWTSLQGANPEFTEGATDFESWVNNLDNGEYDWWAKDIYMYGTKNISFFGSRAVEAGASKTELTFEAGGDAIELTVEGIKFVAKLVPGGAALSTTMDVVQNAGEFEQYKNDFEAKLAEGKTAEEALAEIAQAKSKELGLTDDEAARAAQNIRDNAQHVSRIAEAAESDGVSAVRGPAGDQGLGGAAVMDASTPLGTDRDDPVSLVVLGKNPEDVSGGLLSEGADLVLSWVADRAMEVSDTWDDFVVTAMQGAYDMTVVDAEGNVSDKPDVSISAGVIASALVDTDSVESQAPATPSATVTASVSPSSVETGSDATLTLSVSPAVALPVKVTLINWNGCLMTRAATVTDGDLSFSATASSVAVTLTPATAQTYDFTIGVEDAFGNEYSTTATLNATDAPAPPDDDGDPGDPATAVYVGAALFETDAGTPDEIHWDLTVYTYTSFDGTLSGEVSGTANGMAITGTFTGVWGLGTFDAGGTVSADGGQVGFSFSGPYTGTGDASLTGTISSSGLFVHEFTSQAQ